jgi:hypothetical protein
MALREISRPNVNGTKKPNELKTGESIEGYLTAIRDSQKYPGSFSLVMGSGEEFFYVPTHGNIAFAVKDNLLVLGQYTVITKTGTKVGKSGKTVSNFAIQQDDENTIAVSAAPVMTEEEDDGEALLDAASISPADLKTTGTANRNAGNGVTKKDIEAAGIKARTAQLKAQVNGK